MSTQAAPGPVAIACGGTGGHLFPGIAVGESLLRRQCAVSLFISEKDVDQLAARGVQGMTLVRLPGAGLIAGQRLRFFVGAVKSYFACRRRFHAQPPAAVLAMGGFTSVAPLLAGRRAGARTFLHESNTIAGRANRVLSRFVDTAFVGFPQAGARLRSRHVAESGTPVRAALRPRPAAECRAALGFAPDKPLLLIMGGSQGAVAVNTLVLQSLPLVAPLVAGLQFLHLAGPRDAERVRLAYAELRIPARVEAFFHEMDLALGAATAAVTRAGASSLAELAAVRLPALLVPYPAAADNHQFHNARAYESTGAALVLEQRNASPVLVSRLLCDLLLNAGLRTRLRAALSTWHRPAAAETIAAAMLQAVSAPGAAAVASAAREAGLAPAQAPATP